MGDQLGLAGIQAGRVVIDRPAWARADGITPGALEKHLGYRDQRAAYELQRFRRNPYNFQKYPAAEFDARVEALKAEVDCTLLRFGDGALRFPAGLAARVAAALGVTCVDEVGARLTAEREATWVPAFRWHRDPDKVLRPYQRETVELLKRHRHAAAALSVGMGKAQPLSSRILTPAGWRIMGEMKVGDDVIGRDGKPHKITGVFPQGVKPVFRVVFSDGSATRCCKEHLWQVQTTWEKFDGKRPQILSLKEIQKTVRLKNGNVKWYIPMVAPVEFNPQRVDLDPYLMGALVGDGCLRHGVVMFSNADPQILDEVRARLPALHFLKHASRYDYRILCGRTKNVVKEQLEALGLYGCLAHEKFIPDVYKYNTVEVRLAALRGVMDTDGTVRPKDGHVEFTSCSPRLAADVAEIVRSLGGSTRVRVSSPKRYTYKGVKKTGRRAHRVTITLDGIVPFLLKRKADLYRHGKNQGQTRGLVDVIPDGEDECQCIAVDASDSLYVTDDYIVTHNTLVALHLVRELGERAIVMSPSSSIVEQTYDEFASVLGRRRVGQYGAGRKDTKEDVLICTTQALLRVTGSPAEMSFRTRRVIVGDEAHGLAADAFSKICLDLLADAPYRLFLSGTLARHDGLQLLLDGVVGPTVKTMTLRDGVAGGFLVAPSFRMVGFRNGRDCTTGDPGKATQESLYRSPSANALAGALANQMVDAGRPVLIFVDELDQFARLLPYLRHEARFAHGGADKKRLVDKVPAAHHAAEALDLVRRFNNKEFPVLVGTSCLGTGVDIRATGAAIWFRGGKSVNDLGQGVGRLVRLFDGKTDAVWFDLDPLDGGIAHRHAEAREKAYGDIYPDVQRLVLGE